MRSPDGATQITLLSSPQEFFAELVDSALDKRQLKTHASVRGYLVEVLNFYLDARNLHHQWEEPSGEKKSLTLAEEYLLAMNSDPAKRISMLKNLGDRSLYISGFFGDSLQRKLVDVDYYVQMGEKAYTLLANDTREDRMQATYRSLAKKFIDFVDVLTLVNHQSMFQTDQSILHLYDKYLRTGSKLAQERLIEMGVLTHGAHGIAGKTLEKLKKI